VRILLLPVHRLSDASFPLAVSNPSGSYCFRTARVSASAILTGSGTASKWPLIIRALSPACSFPFSTNGPAAPACALAAESGATRQIGQN